MTLCTPWVVSPFSPTLHIIRVSAGWDRGLLHLKLICRWILPNIFYCLAIIHSLRENIQRRTKNISLFLVTQPTLIKIDGHQHLLSSLKQNTHLLSDPTWLNENWHFSQPRSSTSKQHTFLNKDPALDIGID